VTCVEQVDKSYTQTSLQRLLDTLVQTMGKLIAAAFETPWLAGEAAKLYITL
jgi:hypothetical protein